MEKNEMPIVGTSRRPSRPPRASNIAAGASAAARPRPPSLPNVAAGASAAACLCPAAAQRSAGASAARPASVDWDPYDPRRRAGEPLRHHHRRLRAGVESNDVDNNDESFHTKTRHVLRRLQSGQYDGLFARGIYKCPFCNRRLRDTNFNTLVNHVESIGRYGARVGRTVNVHAYMAKHKALGIHLRNLQASHTRYLEALNVPTALSVCVLYRQLKFM
ncbi:hypothetical protein QYE76_013135 [Lolium multiflorum]|uniref:Uncharacterized protein n=1 Tax=Lolium multiflorum TaxID=4521 RepID=A0AAD8X4A4_LOLMU|nr:hypothetical protein QYE76_013135 [Lolium multiflorum]